MKPSCDTNYFFIETFAVCYEDERLNDSSEYMLNIEGNGKKLLNDFEVGCFQTGPTLGSQTNFQIFFILSPFLP